MKKEEIIGIISNLIKTNNLEKLKDYLLKNNITLKTIDHEDVYQRQKFDPLIYSIQQKDVSIEIISFIIKYYDTLNYNVDEFSPLLKAITEKKFDIADLLIKNKADINYRMSSYIVINKHIYSIYEYIYEYECDYSFIKNKKYISNDVEIFIYLIENGFFFTSNIINNWIESFKNSFLEIYLKYYVYDDDRTIIDDQHYYTAIRKKNLNAVIILLDSDKRDKKDVLYLIYFFYNKIKNNVFYEDNYGDSNLLDINKNKDFNSLDFYSNTLKKMNYIPKKFDPKNFIHKEKYDDYMNQLTTFFKTFTVTREKISEIILKNDIEELNNYMNIHDLHFKEYNTFDFDFLIFAIENKVSFEIINFILTETNYKTLNYIVKINNRNESISKQKYYHEFNSSYRIPLFSAIHNNNFPVADLLMKMGADINYGRDIVIYLYEECVYDNSKFYSIDNEWAINYNNLKYVLTHGYSSKDPTYTDNIIKKLISSSSDAFLELYLEFSSYNEKSKINIKEEYYEEVFKYNNINGLYFLYYYDDRSMKEKKDLINKYIIDDQNDTINKLYLKEFKTSFSPKDFQEKKFNFLTQEKFHQIKKEWNKIINDTLNILKKRKEIKKWIEENNKERLEFHIKEKNLKLKEYNNSNFDLLIYAIEKKVSFNLIDYIINQYESVNYELNIKKKIKNNSDEYNYYSSNKPEIINITKSPLVAALMESNFEVADLLIKKGANINYFNNLITFLYIYKLLDCSKLHYILKNKYFGDKIKFQDSCMPNWINMNEIQYLVIYLYYRSKEPTAFLNITYEYYSEALKSKNDQVLTLLLNQDKKDNYLMMSTLYKIFMDVDNVFFCLSKKINHPKMEYIIQLGGSSVKSGNDKFKDFIEKRYDLFQIIKINDLPELKRYVKKENIQLKDFNSYDYDVLIYAIECDNISMDIIEYIIEEVGYNDFNYFIRVGLNYEYKTPLYSAIYKRHFKIADYLLEKGAKINYENSKCYSYYFNIINFLEVDSLNYLLNKGYNKPMKLIKYINHFTTDMNLKEQLLHALINYYSIDQNLVKLMLYHFQEKTPLSNYQLHKIILHFWDNKIMDKIIEYIREYGNFKTKNILLKYLNYHFDTEKIDFFKYQTNIKEEEKEEEEDYYYEDDDFNSIFIDDEYYFNRYNNNDDFKCDKFENLV